jgi:AcrR family transcriptional regulator
MIEPETRKDTYHHGHLREELIRRGLDALEKEGSEALSLRALAESAGVSKTAPYRHFKDKDLFLGALADEGYRLLHESLTASIQPGRKRSRAGSPVGAMGRAYMAFAVGRPALYRLMNSPLICRMPEEYTLWARKSLLLLAGTLAAARAGTEEAPDAQRAGPPDLDATAAAWAYIHGLVLIRIDGLYPADLPEPDWDRLAGVVPELPASTGR